MKKLLTPIFAGLFLLSGNVLSRDILISIDGTKNDPDDAFAEGDQSISNVLKLHLLAGGGIDTNRNQSSDERITLYYIGVGNEDRRGKFLERIGAKNEALFAIREPQQIHDEVISDLQHHYQPNDRLYIIGFSRGAAIGRRLAQKLAEGELKKDGAPVSDLEIEFLGVFDTVSASLAMKIEEGRNEFGEKGTIHENVLNAYHLVSIDDTRSLFSPTLMGPRDNLQEVWFPGAHSDVGGGYDKDGLSDIPLQYMIERLSDHQFTTKTVVEINDTLEALEWTPDILEIKPNAAGKYHHHVRVGPLKKARRVSVLNSPDAKPVVHKSVFTRIDTPTEEIVDGKEKYKPINIGDESQYVVVE